MMGDRRFGAAGERVVIEDLLRGEEVSYYAITDGEHIVTLAAAQDHKRALDGDRGENTGGMGAYSPAPVLSHGRVEKRVVSKRSCTRRFAACGRRDTPYVGVLFVGLMIDDATATPNVVEFNVRFGDPETQPLMMRMESDLVPLLDAAARGRLDGIAPPTWGDAAVCVVLASGGYPREFRKGLEIHGLDEAAGDPDVEVFHAGTRRNESGEFVTSGGRVLGVTARGGADVRAVECRGDGGIALRVRGPEAERAARPDAVVVATSAPDAALIAAPALVAAERDGLAAVRYQPALSLAVGLRRPFFSHARHIHVPHTEGSPLESVLLEPGVRGGRVPDGRGLALLRATGAWSEASFDAPDEAVSKELLRAFARVHPGAELAVLFSKLYRVERAVPRFAVGHYRGIARFERVQRALRREGRRLYFAGDYLVDPSLEGALASAQRAAAAVAEDQPRS